MFIVTIFMVTMQGCSSFPAYMQLFATFRNITIRMKQTMWDPCVSKRDFLIAIGKCEFLQPYICTKIIINNQVYNIVMFIIVFWLGVHPFTVSLKFKICRMLTSKLFLLQYQNLKCIGILSIDKIKKFLNLFSLRIILKYVDDQI